MLALAALVVASAAVPSNATWEVLSSSPVYIECAKVGATPWCRSEAIIEAPVDAVVGALRNMRYSADKFESVVAIDVLADDTLRIQLDYPEPLDDRDYVAKYTYRQEGPAHVYAWSPAAAAAPEVDGVVRLPKFEGEWRLEARGDQTWVRYTWHAEIAGTFPTWAYSQAWKKAGHEALKDLARTQSAKYRTGR